MSFSHNHKTEHIICIVYATHCVYFRVNRSGAGWREGGASLGGANVIKKLSNRININVWRIKFCAFDNFRLPKS